jgi:hypothetical protein
MISGAVFAQSKPFSEINLGISGGYNSSSEPLTDFWNVPFSAEGFLSTNFYAGIAQIGVKFIPLQSLSDKQPSINSFFIYIGWYADYNLTKELSVLAGVKAGSYLMLAEKGTLSTYQQSESELAFGPTAALNYKVLRRLSINITADFFRIYTFNRINFVNISVGMSYSFYTQKWFREILE